MEKIYQARLRDFRGGLKRLKFKGFCSFTAGHNQSARVYCNLMRAALDYRYRNHAGTAIPMSDKDLAVNPVFEFKESDRIPVSPTSTVDGKRLRELFVTSIYAGYLDGLSEYNGFKIKDRRLFIAYPEQDSSVDSAIFITEMAPLVRDGNYLFRAIAGKSSLSLYIQVKEYYQYNDFQQAILYPKAFQVSNLGVAKLRSYTELILVYVRSFCTIDFSDIKKDLVRNGLAGKNIVLIGTKAMGTEPLKHCTREYTFWDFARDAVFTTPIPVCNLFKTREEIEKLQLGIKKPRR